MSFKALTSRSLPLGLSLVLILTAALAQAQTAADKATSKTLSPDTVLVKVNGTPIKQADIDNWVEQTIKSEYGKRGMKVEQIPAEQQVQMRQMLQSVAREQVIMKTLVTAAAKPYLNKVDKEVEDQVKEIRKNAAAQGVTDLEKYLTERGSSLDEAKNNIRQRQATIKFIESTEGSVEPTAKQIEDACDQVRTSHILIGFGEQARTPGYKPADDEKAKVKAKAEQVYKELKAGGEFGKLAEKYSDDPGSKDKGGSYDMFISRGGPFVKEYNDAAFKLQKAGDISPITESPFGYHIIRLDEKKKLSPEEAKNSPAMMELKNENTQKKGQAAMMKLQKSAKIETLVADPNSESAFGTMMGARQGDKQTTATAARPNMKSGAAKPKPLRGKSSAK